MGSNSLWLESMSEEEQKKATKNDRVTVSPRNQMAIANIFEEGPWDILCTWPSIVPIVQWMASDKDWERVHADPDRKTFHNWFEARAYVKEYLQREAQEHNPRPESESEA